MPKKRGTLAELPSNPDIEREVLACCFRDSTENLNTVREHLKDRDFHLVDHQRVFRSLCRLADAHEPLTWANVYQDMNGRGEPIQLSQLVDYEGLPYALGGNIRTLLRLSLRRRLLVRLVDLQRAASDTTYPVEDLLEQTANAAKDVDSTEAASGETAAEIIGEAGGVDGLLSPSRGIATPWPDLTRCGGGWQNKDLILIAARPSMGKTAFALNALWDAARRGIPSVFYSLEMSRESIIRRLISLIAAIPFQDIQRGELNASDRRAVAEAISLLHEAPLRIKSAAGKTPTAIAVHAERLRSRGLLRFAAVDYIGLVRGETPEFNRNRELGAICRQFKEIAAQLDIPILVLSQLSRASESRPDRRPFMSDLRDSGELEEHADLIAFLHRPGYYARQNDTIQRDAELIIAKYRNGDTPTINLQFRREYGRFESPAPEEASES